MIKLVIKLACLCIIARAIGEQFAYGMRSWLPVLWLDRHRHNPVSGDLAENLKGFLYPSIGQESWFTRGPDIWTSCAQHMSSIQSVPANRWLTQTPTQWPKEYRHTILSIRASISAQVVGTS